MADTHPKQELEHLRHSAAHLLAAAVLRLWPEAKLTLGPATDDGFYYDIDFGKEKVSEDDFRGIEKEMSKIVQGWQEFSHEEVSVEKARELYVDNPYKLEMIEEISGRGEPITLYTAGGFTDLCRGGHVESPSKELQHFKLLKVAGAYWRGSEENPMLTRIYGTAFASKKELDEYLTMLEEAKKRDHRKLGQQLDLFTFSPLVGSGLPMFTPRGTVIRMQLQEALMDISKKYGMLPVMIPHIAKRELYDTSGHSQKFGDELLTVQSHYDEFVMKPVNCPHHTQIYASQKRSYRDLPLRYMETTMQYRDEKPGEIGGLTRVRAITVDDGHIFCRLNQVKEEAGIIIRIIEEFYTSLGLYDDKWVSLSVRDPENPDVYIGSSEDWEAAESMLAEIAVEHGLNATRVEGEAAIYGPKLDFMFRDSLGREWQLATIQIDFSTPKRFELSYTSEEGQEETPVMIHRAVLGSYERFMAILLEHFAGALPLWLSPTQVAVLPISDEQIPYAQEVAMQLQAAGVRVEVDERSESVGKKIREAETMKTPVMLVVGQKEVEAKSVAVRERGNREQRVVTVAEISEELQQRIKERS